MPVKGRGRSGWLDWSAKGWDLPSLLLVRQEQKMHHSKFPKSTLKHLRIAEGPAHACRPAGANTFPISRSRA